MNTYRIYNFPLLFLCICAMVFFLFPFRLYALTLSPSRIEVVGDAGTVVTHEMTVVNETDKTQTYYPSFANFEAQGDDGSPVFVDPKEGLGTWMSIGGPLTLKGGESKTVTLTISIPKGTPAGGNFAAIFWGTTPPSASQGVSVGSRVGSLVLLSVSGAITESFGLVDFHTSEKQWLYKMLPVGFEYRFSNQGGDRIKPVASITIRSVFGWRVARIDANPFEGNVLPNTTRKFTPQWSKTTTFEAIQSKEEGYSFFRSLKNEWKNFAFGIFKAKLFTEFGTKEQRTKSASVYFVVVPWELLLVIIAGGYVLLRLLKVGLRRYNRSVIRKAQGVANDKSV